MNKSLVPLIISFAVIILLTFIVINSKPGRSDIAEDETEINKSMKLSPFPVRHPRSNVKETKETASLKNPYTLSAYSPDTAKTLDKIRKLLAEEKEKEAEDLLRTLLVFEPDNQQALSFLGGILFYSQRYQEAEMIFRRQIKLEPDEKANLYNQLASVLAKQKKFDEAIKMASKAVELDPNSAVTRINLAGMYSLTGDKENAFRHLLSAYQLARYGILPFTHDPSFDAIRTTPEFQEIIRQSNKDWDEHLKSINKTENPSKTETP